MKRNNYSISNTLLVLGGLLTILGFIYPGWALVLLTPGDVEMLPLAAITLVGFAGVLGLIAGGVLRIRESKKFVQEDQTRLP
jgi:hypothetical protein